MSEQQEEYEPDTDTRFAGFASTPWEPEPPEREDGIAQAHVWGSDGDLVATVCDNPVYGETAYDRARLIAAAGTAAHEAKEMGYDPVAAVEALPELIEAAKKGLAYIRRWKSYEKSQEPRIDGSAWPETLEAEQIVVDALASAEGD